MNALTDEPLCRALAYASQCGVHIDIVVRGACVLPAGVPGVTDRIRVRSVVGRMLEHSRVFYAQVGDQEQLWLSSADWMNRNMLRRVELAWPVTDPALKRRVIEECLDLYLADNRDAWDLQPDGRYTRATAPAVGKGRVAPSVSAQASLMARYGRKG
jgi:polyphosphate kinase